MELPQNFMKITESILEANEAFCKSNEIAHGTWTEIIELMNDAIDNVMWKAKKSNSVNLFLRYAMLNYFSRILMPISYGIYLDFLAGNLPVCFTQLRTLLEQLAKCSMSDRNYPELAFFKEKLRALEDAMERKSLSLTRLIAMTALDGSSIWHDISEDWVHIKRFDRIMTVVGERHDIPGWSLTIPIDYSDTELPEIEELGKYVNQFRQILAKEVEEWRIEVLKEV